MRLPSYYPPIQILRKITFKGHLSKPFMVSVAIRAPKSLKPRDRTRHARLGFPNVKV